MCECSTLGTGIIRLILSTVLEPAINFNFINTNIINPYIKSRGEITHKLSVFILWIWYCCGRKVSHYRQGWSCCGQCSKPSPWHELKKCTKNRLLNVKAQNTKVWIYHLLFEGCIRKNHNADITDHFKDRSTLGTV